MILNEGATPGPKPGAAQRKRHDKNYAQSAHGTQLRLPPYANRLRPRAGQSLFVVIGRRGWDLFQRQGQGIDYGILLPDPDPAGYRWPDLSGWPDALIIDTTDCLTADEEREIARALLAAGCPHIVGRWSSYARRADA